MKGRTTVAILVAALLAQFPVPRASHAAPPQMPSRASGGFLFGEPAYDSGWRDISAGEYLFLSHNLGGDRSACVVDLQGRSDSGDRHAYYGGDWASASIDRGIYWSSLTTSIIKVTRADTELLTTQVRVRIWVVPNADYDSRWTALPAASTLPLNHQLGGDTDNYLVYLEMYSPVEWVNQIAYGRLSRLSRQEPPPVWESISRSGERGLASIVSKGTVTSV
jgi:hypothetical protein